MSVINIKNKYKRRLILLIVMFPIFILTIIIYPIKGLYEGLQDWFGSIKNCWEGL